MKQLKILAALLVFLSLSITGIANQSQETLINEIDSLKFELEKVKLELDKSKKEALIRTIESDHKEYKLKRTKIINLSIVIFTSVLLIVLIIFIYKFYRFKKLRNIAKEK